MNPEPSGIKSFDFDMPVKISTIRFEHSALNLGKAHLILMPPKFP